MQDKAEAIQELNNLKARRVAAAKYCIVANDASGTLLDVEVFEGLD